MRELSSGLACVLLLVALSGCFGGGGNPPDTSGPAMLTTVTGLVLDDGEFPLSGADVRILLTNLTATTDGNGSYRIDEAPVGPVALVASAAAHLGQERRVTLAGGVVNRVDFQLLTLTVPQPFNRTTPFTGTVSCNLPQAGGCGTEAGLDESTHPFTVEPGLAGVLIEMRWQASVGTSGERLTAELRAANETACGLPVPEGTETARSPLRLEVGSGFAISGGYQCLIVSAPADALAVNQGYEAWVTLFYHSGIAGGFTAMPAS